MPPQEKAIGKDVGSLHAYLKLRNAEDNQLKRYLATAAWLIHRGQKEVNSQLIAETLKDHQQNKLTNPADCLNKNVKHGFCEKTKEGFFITPEGWKHLGEPQ